jgi:hypothetical protein
VLVHLAIYGIKYEADEGTAARIFQLLMAVQVPVILYFLFRYLPRRIKATLLVFMLQVTAWILPVMVILILEKGLY